MHACACVGVYVCITRVICFHRNCYLLTYIAVLNNAYITICVYHVIFTVVYKTF